MGWTRLGRPVRWSRGALDGVLLGGVVTFFDTTSRSETHHRGEQRCAAHRDLCPIAAGCDRKRPGERTAMRRFRTHHAVPKPEDYTSVLRVLDA